MLFTQTLFRYPAVISAGNDRRRLAASGRRHTIQTKLLFAFTLLTSFTVLASFVAFLSYRSLSGRLFQIESTSLPRLTLLLSISRQASALSSLLGDIAVADSSDDLKKALEAVTQFKTAMSANLTALSSSSGGELSSNQLRTLADELSNCAATLGRAVDDRLALRSQRLTLIWEATKAHRDIYEKLAPAFDDANFNLTMGLRRSAAEGGTRQAKGLLTSLADNELPTLIALSELRAETNLIIGILSESSLLPDRAQLVPLRDRLLASSDRARRALNALDAHARRREIGRALQRLLTFAADDSIVSIRERELAAYDEGWRLVKDSRSKGERLALAAEKLAAQSREAVSREIAVSNADAATHRIFLASLSLLSIAALVGAFLFIRHNIAQRLNSLINSIYAIANGNLTAAVPTGGNDELADLGAAVETFKANALRVRELEAERRKALDRAEKAVQAKSEFLSNMSHELRTPMHAILSYSKMGFTKLGSVEIAVLEKFFKSIHTSGTRLLGLLNNILDLARLESGKMVFKMLPGDFSEVITQSIIELDPLIVEKNIHVAIEIDAKTAKLVFDKQRMIQVMINVLSNAIKFSPPCGTVTINLSKGKHLRGAETLLCSVTDSGAGIPESEIEAIFEKFVQSSKTKTGAGGSGLGLSICREIIRAHGGKIWAENAKEGGVILTFLIPRNAEGGVWSGLS